jgi:hypothetical protein
MITTPTIPSSGTFGAFRPQLPRKKSFVPYIIVIIIILVAGVGYYFFFYQGIGLSLGVEPLPPIPQLTTLDMKVSQLPSFSFDLFDSPFYKSLKSYGSLPVVADLLGRTNPFIPY